MPESWSIRRSTPAIILVIAVTAVIGLWVIERRARDERQHLGLEDTAHQLAYRFDDFAIHRLGALQILKAQIEELPNLNKTDFGRLASDTIKHYSGFQAINWVDEDHIIRWVNPQAGNEAALGQDLDDNPNAGRAIAEADAKNSLSVTPPLPLYQGGLGYTVYLPLVRNGQKAGFVNGVFRVDDLVLQTLESRKTVGLSYKLIYRGKEVFTHNGAGAEEPHWEGSASARTEDPLDGWEIRIAAPAQQSFTHYLLLAIGLLLSVFLSFIVHIALKREDLVLSNEARFRHLVSAAREGVWVADEAGRATFVNQRVCDLLGQDESSLLGQRIEEILDESLQLPAADLLESPDSSPHARGRERDYRYRREDGSEVWLRIVASSVVENSMASRSELVLISDISHRRRLEAQLLQTRKMEALGRLAGGIAHDFNNMLTAILAGCDLARLDLPADSEARHRIDEVADSAKRAARLTSRLLTFSRQKEVDPQPVDLCELVADMETISRRAVQRQNLTLEFILSSEPIPVRIDKTQFDQVLLNLVVNASDSMPDGGQIRVEVSRMHVPRIERMGRRLVGVGDYGVLDVIDQGRGIPDELSDLVFEPFFTTKESGTGTGLGLATVHGVVAQAGGVIVLESSESGGTLFRVLFPIST